MNGRTSIVAAALIASFASTGSAHAAIPWDEIPTKERDAWQRLIGLEAGIALMHCVQPLSAAAGEIEWRPKLTVAIAGCAVYGANTIGLVYRQKWALWVNIIGPLVGITAVTGGWVLNRAGVINADIRPDVPQVVGGVLQTWAWIESFRLLARYKKRGESLLRHPRVTPAPGGVQLLWSW